MSNYLPDGNLKRRKVNDDFYKQFGIPKSIFKKDGKWFYRKAMTGEPVGPYDTEQDVHEANNKYMEERAKIL